MSRPGVYPLIWGCMLGAAAGLLWVWSYGLPGAGAACPGATCVQVPVLAPALLTAAAAGSILPRAGARAAANGGDRPRPPSGGRPEHGQCLACVALGLTALGGAVGVWLVWVGLGLTAAALGGVLREGAGHARAAPEGPRRMTRARRTWCLAGGLALAAAAVCPPADAAGRRLADRPHGPAHGADHAGRAAGGDRLAVGAGAAAGPDAAGPADGAVRRFPDGALGGQPAGGLALLPALQALST